MKRFRWQAVRKLRELLEETAPPPEQMALRLRLMERDVILPVKGVFVLILIYSFYFSPWFEGDPALAQSVAQQTIERFFVIYLVINLGVAAILIFARRIAESIVQRVIFTASFLDGLFLAALTFATGGFDSILYWLFLGLIVRNAVSCPLAAPQLILNFSVSICYLAAGMLDVLISDSSLSLEETSGGLRTTEPFLLRLILLWLLSACCYGLQVLFEKQRRAAEESQEFAVRQEQLRSAGRLAAKIAHQIKNPLGIINTGRPAAQSFFTTTGYFAAAGRAWSTARSISSATSSRSILLSASCA